MEKAMHSRPVPEEYETLSCSKKPRLEASPSSEDIEKYTIFTDSEYKLPLYLSQFALSVFNSEKKASYEKVNVVKTMKSVDVDKGKIYLVTFEASLPNKSNNAKTFQTNIFMSTFPLEPIAKLKINFVRMKPSGFDYNGEEDFEEMVFEAKEEGSVVAVSGFDVEDFEEELFDESDEEDNEEKQSESDEEDSEEKQSESDEEDSEEKQSESDEVSDEFDEEENEEKLSEYEKDSEEKLAVRKTVGGKGPRQCSIDVKKSDVVWGRKGPRRHRKYRKEIKLYSKELSDESDEEDNEEKLSESADKDIAEKPAVRKTVGGKGPRGHPKYSEEIKQYSDEVSDESDEEENEENDLSEYEKDSEEKLVVRKTVGEKGPRAVEKDIEEKLSKLAQRRTVGDKGPRRHPKYGEEMEQYSIDVEKSDVSESEVEGSEEDISESKRKIPKRSSLNKEEDNEEKLSKSDDKDTDRKVGQRKTVGVRIRMPQRKTVGGKGPRIQLYYGSWTYYDPPNKNVSTASLTELVYLSQLAICVYNMKEATYYDNVKVLKVMQSPCAGRTYHITFEASLSDGNAITFQTKIWVCLPLPYHKIEINFVRIKPSINSNDR